MSADIRKWTDRFLDGSQPNGAFARDAEIADLRAALAAAECDAARYHAMKENDFTCEYSDYISDSLNEMEAFDLDAAIDAAMSTQQQGEKSE